MKKNLIYRYLFLSIFGICSLGSCKRSSIAIESVKLIPDKIMDMLSDSTFFSLVQCMNESEGDIYISMDQRMQIARMDEDFNLKATIGKSGRGPQEFIFMNSFFVTNDVIWAGDPGKLLLLRFSTEGEFIDAVKKSKRRYTLDDRFWVEGNKIYFSKSNSDKKTSLAVLDLDEEEGNNYRQFGEWTEFSSTENTNEQNRRNVFVFQR